MIIGGPLTGLTLLGARAHARLNF